MISIAGIGGLTTALWLHHQGIDDRQVYEQSTSIGELGVRSNALPHAVEVLSELGLLERLDKAAIRASYNATPDPLTGASPASPSTGCSNDSPRTKNRPHEPPTNR